VAAAETLLNFLWEHAMPRFSPRRLYYGVVLATSALLAVGQTSAQDLLNDNPTYSPFNLALRPYVTMPAGSANIISMTTRRGDNRLYVTTQEGRVHLITPNANGTGTPSTWFDISTTGGLSGTGGQLGLQSIAFHPEFDQVGAPGYGKFYATLTRNNLSSANFLGSTSQGAGVSNGVLAEWTYNHANGTFGGSRELFRVKMPVNDHPIKQARFNPYAKPGDEDYGLLYMTHGDSNDQHSPNDHPQLLNNALGKMIRINPLDPDGAGAARYSIPATNPFANNSDPTVLKEIYAYGFRNPHNFSFNPDDNGNTHILVGNIGRANVEEVELALPGENYGWPKREGTFVEKQIANNAPGNPDAGYITGVDPLPANEVDFGYSFPVAQFDHNATPSQTSSGSAIASGHVIRNGSDPNLENQLIFGNFSRHTPFAYHADFDEMLTAVTKLDADDSNRDEPSELTQAPVHLLRLALDHDNNPDTPAQIYDDFNSLVNNTRNDTRFGEGVFGEMYISTKLLGGEIYLVINSVPLSGDFNKDRVVDAADFTVWRDSLESTGYHLAADGNGDGKVDAADYDVWKSHFGETWGAAGRGAGSLSVPEPASAAVLAFGCAFIRIRRIGQRFTH
jgi:glucose/arabinose dehydrogenase